MIVKTNGYLEEYYSNLRKVKQDAKKLKECHLF